MDITIRHLEESTYQQLQARAALIGRAVGDPASLHDLEPEDYPDGNERLSESIDARRFGEDVIPKFRKEVPSWA